jgi:hypothetical protein
VHTVVRLAGFFTEHGNIELGSVSFIEKILNKAVADHAVTDDSESDFAHFCLDFFSITAYLNDSAGRLLMQIKYVFAYSLGGMRLICQDFYKLWKSQAFRCRRFCVQIRAIFEKYA